MTGRVELGRSADSATNRRDAADFGASPATIGRAPHVFLRQLRPLRLRL
jgi:hypothetical protein